jgi:hypothetical protein
LEGLHYNTTREDLKIPEYGRNIKNMIEHAVSVTDKEERNKIAKAIISVMGQLNPHLRDVEDFTHKLWDHLFIISDFKLDVDSPYPLPDQDQIEEKPELLTYSKDRIRFSYYGKSIMLFINAAIAKPEGEEKDAAVLAIVNLMKKSFLTWNKDYVEDEVILTHLKELSKGELTLKDTSLIKSISDLAVTPMKNTFKKKKNYGKKNNNNRNNNYKHKRKN